MCGQPGEHPRTSGRRDRIRPLVSVSRPVASAVRRVTDRTCVGRPEQAGAFPDAAQPDGARPRRSCPDRPWPFHRVDLALARDVRAGDIDVAFAFREASSRTIGVPVELVQAEDDDAECEPV